MEHRQRLEAEDPKAIETELRLCKEDRWHWATNWVYSKDSDDHENPIKRFPPHEYLRVLDAHLDAEIARGNRRHLIVKARRKVISTYFMNVRFLHRCLFFHDQELYVQSKKELTAQRLLDRTELAYKRLPKWMATVRCKTTKRPPTIQFPHTGSVIFGVQEGREAIRGEGATEFLSDEFDFQMNARQSIGAIMPALGRTGVFYGVTTPNGPQYCYALYTDAEDSSV